MRTVPAAPIRSGQAPWHSASPAGKDAPWWPRPAAQWFAPDQVGTWAWERRNSPELGGWRARPSAHLDTGRPLPGGGLLEGPFAGYAGMAGPTPMPADPSTPR